MGGTSWSSSFYDARSADKRSRGIDAFAYDADTRTKPRSSWTVHAQMNPYQVTRESRDSDAHPESLAIAVFFDVTGSMGGIPRVLQQKLPRLMSMLLDKHYVDHPQILFGAIGDAYWDHVPLQVGQFESGVEMDEDLERLLLEGGGGGSMQESYELALYFAARHTKTDCVDQRGVKGYCFLIGDEMPYQHSSRDQVSTLIGDTLEDDIPVERIMEELEESYHVFFIIPSGASHGHDPRLEDRWTELLGERVLRLDDPNAVCETIALAIGINEGRIDLDDGLSHLDSLHVDGSTRAAVSQALVPFAKAGLTKRATVTGTVPTASPTTRRMQRLS